MAVSAFLESLRPGRNLHAADSWLDRKVFPRGEKRRQYSALSLVPQISGYAQ